MQNGGIFLDHTSLNWMNISNFQPQRKWLPVKVTTYHVLYFPMITAPLFRIANARTPIFEENSRDVYICEGSITQKFLGQWFFHAFCCASKSVNLVILSKMRCWLKVILICFFLHLALRSITAEFITFGFCLVEHPSIVVAYLQIGFSGCARLVSANHLVTRSHFQEKALLKVVRY